MTDPVAAALRVFGAYHLGLGLLMVLAPGTFFDALGPFGVRNDHFIRDAASFDLPLGALLLLAAARPAWRVPALVFATAHWVLHAVNHLVDIGEADPGWVGVLDFVALSAGAAILVVTLRAAARAPA